MNKYRYKIEREDLKKGVDFEQKTTCYGKNAIEQAFYGYPELTSIIEKIVYAMNYIAVFYFRHNFLWKVRARNVGYGEDTLKYAVISIGIGSNTSSFAYRAVYNIANDKLLIWDYDASYGNGARLKKKVFEGLYATYLAVLSKEHEKFKEYLRDEKEIDDAKTVFALIS